MTPGEEAVMVLLILAGMGMGFVAGWHARKDFPRD